MPEVIHLALYQSKDFTLLIEYELIDGDAIAINHVDIQARPMADFEQRERDRRKLTIARKSRQGCPAVIFSIGGIS